MKTRFDPYLCLEDQTYISEELEELLYERWLQKMNQEAEKKAKMLRDLWNLFFVGNICILHDQELCNECRVYGTGTCPSAKEEGRLPHDF
jgi:hypothetical protein